MELWNLLTFTLSLYEPESLDENVYRFQYATDYSSVVSTFRQKTAQYLTAWMQKKKGRWETEKSTKTK